MTDTRSSPKYVALGARIVTRHATHPPSVIGEDEPHGPSYPSFQQMRLQMIDSCTLARA